MMNQGTNGVQYADVVKEAPQSFQTDNNIAAGNPNENAGPSYFKILYSDDTVVEKAKKIGFLSKQHLQSVLSTIRPWREFFDKSFFSVPNNATDILGRLSRNFNHFYSNYIIISIVCSLWVLLTNLLFSFCVLVAVSGFIFVKTKSAADLQHHVENGGDPSTAGSIPVLRLFGAAFTSSQCYAFLAIFSVLAFFLFSGSSVLFWLGFTSLGVSVTHATFRRPPIENDNALYQYA